MSCSSHPATDCYGPDSNNHPDQKELSERVSNLNCDRCQIGAPLALGHDGVLRALMPNSEVIDAIGLPPRLIKALLDRNIFKLVIEDMFRGADGTNVPQAQG
ncbi:hypothetical protein BDV25DRAFT_139430 [Aspergillus avenaceus]|uniref:Uncharacterized protein n=1 Tax=Aspergillus avenaceus TaxID=36643 RepID=A0A5N6TWS4_ASPAV|nr:hypothetical protein BDV25DRAFT_139430 [Aspergillus avenaceus]